MFKKAVDPKEQTRQIQRDLKKNTREIDREKAQLERQEKQLEMEIKKMAEKGDKEGAVRLAKQLIQVRKAKTRLVSTNSKIATIQTQATLMKTNMTMANSMATASKTMGVMNKQMDQAGIHQTMQQFQKESMKMEASEELMNDTLDSIFDDSDLEDESDSVMHQVLDEIGLDIKSKLVSAPTSKLPVSEVEDQDVEDLVRKLDALKTP